MIVLPGTGTNLDEIRLRTSAGCPAQANSYCAKMRGHDFPPDGQIVTVNTKAGLSHSHGFDVWVGLIMRDYANKNRGTLTGRYDITVYCIDHITRQSYGESPVRWNSPVPRPMRQSERPSRSDRRPRRRTWVLMGSRSIRMLHRRPPVSHRSLVRAVGNAGQPIPQVSSGQAPGVDSQVQSQAGQLAFQCDRGTDPGASWLILIGAVLGAALIVGLVTRQIRRRRSS